MTAGRDVATSPEFCFRIIILMLVSNTGEAELNCLYSKGVLPHRVAEGSVAFLVPQLERFIMLVRSTFRL
jgi:hypothetical protein